MTDSTTAQKRNYHHGDLRQSLLDNATRILGEQGVDGLSMRKLAEQTGVSRTAPYHHFKDKSELLCAIAERGFNSQIALLDRLRHASGDTPDRAVFEDYVTTYIRFAAENPETYDLMFGKEIWKRGEPTAALKEISHRSFQNWRNWVQTLQQQGLLAPEQPTLRAAQASWATLHGLCRLLNDGVYTDMDNLEAMGKTAAAMLLSN